MNINQTMEKDEVKDFVDFFINQDPAKVVEAMELINTAMEKNIEDLELCIKLATNPKIKEIFKNIMKLKIDKL